jgi:hypothetical protein
MTAVLNRTAVTAPPKAPPVPAVATKHTLTVIGRGVVDNSVIEWRTDDPKSLTPARTTFNYLRNAYGFWAYTDAGPESTVIHEFVPDADILMHARHVGG